MSAREDYPNVEWTDESDLMFNEIDRLRAERDAAEADADRLGKALTIGGKFDGTSMALIDIVFDGPPGPNTGEHHCNFVECETLDGRSVRVGEWIDRGNGLWALRIPLADTPTLVETKNRICITHGVVFEYDDKNTAFVHGGRFCDLRPLVYVEPKSPPSAC